MTQDVWDLVKSRRVVDGKLDDLWTRKNKPQVQRKGGSVTVRPTEFELQLPFFRKDLRDVVKRIPGSQLAGEGVWKIPMSGESMANVATLLHDDDFYLVDWTELARDPAVQKERAPNSWGAVGVNDHGVLKKNGPKKGRGTAEEIEAAKSEEDESEVSSDSDLTKSVHRKVKSPGSRHGKGFYDTDGWHYGDKPDAKNTTTPEPWQMTFGAYKGVFGPGGKAPVSKDISDEKLRDLHQRVLSDAIDVGKDVHPKVVSPYPNLAGIAAQSGNPGKLPVAKLASAAIAAFKDGGKDSPKFRSIMRNAQEKMPAKDFEALWDKVSKSEEESLGEDLDSLAKSVHHHHRHAHHPAHSVPCSYCAGLGYHFHDHDDDEDDRDDQLQHTGGVPTPDPTAAVAPLAMSQDDTVVVDDKPLEKSAGRFCFSCDKGEANGASFSKLPDSNYCDACLTVVGRTR